ncbi:MAG TPA: SMC-Scp complex subunit ScpB [Synergistales bacterium]|nr:SMC-Scp complex subunit ScpB [Synergistales bacterium]
MSSFRQNLSLSELERYLEAILFVSNDPLIPSEDLSSILKVSRKEIISALESLRSHYQEEDHGMVLKKVSGGWKLYTAPDISDVLDNFRDSIQRQHIRLSKASMESLAVIAYNQPVTRSEIEEIRGVRCERVIDTLLSHGLIKIAGRGKGTGSPLLYRTTEHFLEIFGLDSISELPSLEELADLVSQDDLQETWDKD